MSDEPKRYVVDPSHLPAHFPTHRHSKEFWEALGRVVGSFGFLEETLGKAIFAFSGMRKIPEDQVGEELKRWYAALERTLSDPLGNLIDSYSKAVRSHGDATVTNLDDLVDSLRKAAVIRNVLCHGSWRSPDASGRSLPFFVNRKTEVFQTPVDVPYLDQVQRHVAELSVSVTNTVTHMGWQFPGSSGPGTPL